METPERFLWRVVMAAALRAEDAAAWLQSRDAAMVCALAGFDLDAVRRAYVEGRVQPLKRGER